MLVNSIFSSSHNVLYSHLLKGCYTRDCMVTLIYTNCMVTNQNISMKSHSSTLNIYQWHISHVKMILKKKWAKG